MESHKSRPHDWEYVITHPTVITAVLRHVVKRLAGRGRVSILDGPMTEASFSKLIDRFPVREWMRFAEESGVDLEVIDLREHEWVMKNEIVVERRQLPGDPRGKVLVDLRDEYSEFYGHHRSRRGYYGADYDRHETNAAHDGHHNLYSVSRTVLESDVFVNIPKLKTHRTAGITACLKNLVGINTHKNFLPHYSEGGPAELGDQFPTDTMSARMEGSLVGLARQYLFKFEALAQLLAPLNTAAKQVFGDSRRVIRNGSWYGNDTLWRTIVDLNKILFYANCDGSMREAGVRNSKHYIGVVDAIAAGDGEGPLSPDPVVMGRLICGANPVSIDVVCARLMGYSPVRIPSLFRAACVRHYPFFELQFSDIIVKDGGRTLLADDLPRATSKIFQPQHGWIGHIESEMKPSCG